MLRPLRIDRLEDHNNAWGERKSNPSSSRLSSNLIPSSRPNIVTDCTYEISFTPKGHKPVPPTPINQPTEVTPSTPRTPLGTPRTPTGSPRKVKLQKELSE